MGCHLQRNPGQTDVFFHPSMGTRILCNPAPPRKPRGQRHLYARASLCAEFLPSVPCALPLLQREDTLHWALCPFRFHVGLSVE